MSADSLIYVHDLCKHFRTFRRREGVWGSIQNLFVRDYRTVSAVDRVGFSIERGEMVGYIGPNGAGKSTTIKMLTGILVPTSGEIRVNGFVPFRQRRQYVKTIGVVFGQRTQLWWDIAVIESFKLLRRIYDVSQRDFDARMERFNEILGISDYLHTPVRKLSLGERMRCDLAAALLHNPPLLFLDEPTIGLDVVAKDHIRQFPARHQSRIPHHRSAHHARPRRHRGTLPPHHDHRPRARALRRPSARPEAKAAAHQAN